MFLLFICIRAQFSKWLSCPSNNSIWLLTGEAPHMLDNWVMALSHPSIFMYPYGVWWTVQYNGMLLWRSWDYSLAWWTMTGGMKHFLSARVKTSKVHQNGARSPVCIFHIFPLKLLVSTHNLAPFTVGVKPNFITVPRLSGSWLDMMESGWDNCSMMILMWV